MVRETIIRLAQASAERNPTCSLEGDKGPTASIEAFEAWFLTHARSAEISTQRVPAEIGETLGRFRILRKLGSGGFGLVFLAFDPLLQREIALKLPRPELLLSPNWADRVLHEARVAATLDHPGIVPVHEVGAIGPVWYIASAYCDGHSLAAQIASQTSLMAISAATELIACVAAALQHAHARGVLHRDLKAANILLTTSSHELKTENESTSRWSPRLTDFGLAVRQMDPSPTPVPRIAGTPAYMPPELAVDSGVHSIQSDIYSLGAVLFELLTGRPPFVAETTAATLELVKQGPAPSVRSVRPEVPADLGAVVARCLSHHPEARYESAAALESDLRGCLAGRPVSARPLGSIAYSVRWCRNRPVLATLVALLLISGLISAIGITWQWRRAEKHLAIAEAERNRAERRSVQVERALLDWSTAIEESEFRRDHTRPPQYPQFISATSPFRSILFDPDERGHSLPLLAMSHDQNARHHESRNEFAIAKEYHRKSIEQWFAIIRGMPDDPLYRRRFNQACYAYGRFLLIREQLPNGLVLIYDGHLLEIVPLSDELGFDLAKGYLQFLYGYGTDLAKARGWEGATATFAATRDFGRALLNQRPDDAQLGGLLVGAMMKLGKTTRSEGNRQAGVALLHQARAEAAHLLTTQPENVEVAIRLAETCEELVLKEFKGNDRERLALLKEGTRAIELVEQHAAEQASSAVLRIAAKLFHEFATSEGEMGIETTRVQELLLRACAYSDRLLAMSDSTPADAGAAAARYFEAAQQFSRMAKEDEALRFAAKAVGAFDARESVGKPRLSGIDAYAKCCSFHATHLHSAGQQNEAANALQKGIAMIEKYESRFPTDKSLIRMKADLRAQLESLSDVDRPTDSAQ